MVKIIHPEDRDTSTAQTAGMRREAGICGETTEAQGLWMGVGKNEPSAASGAHHHGEYESGIFILEGSIRFRWGDKLEHVQDTKPGDFVFVPPYEVHMEEKPRPGERGGVPAGPERAGGDRRERAGPARGVAGKPQHIAPVIPSPDGPQEAGHG